MATELLQSIGSAGDPLVVDLRFSNYIQITPHCPHAAQIIGSKSFHTKKLTPIFWLFATNYAELKALCAKP